MSISLYLLLFAIYLCAAFALRFPSCKLFHHQPTIYGTSHAQISFYKHHLAHLQCNRSKHLNPITNSDWNIKKAKLGAALFENNVQWEVLNIQADSEIASIRKIFFWISRYNSKLNCLCTSVALAIFSWATFVRVKVRIENHLWPHRANEANYMRTKLNANCPSNKSPISTRYL